ncbi:MAG: formate dehydrogenase subunit alpha [Pseudomonadota bacterium]|nr:formate dehydrogenase subunit alpha [Pseudomonadota bacterium]
MALDGSTEKISFTLDGKTVSAAPGETIWQVAQGNGIDIPHLCYAPSPGYRADGNCRACMVEIEGERVLAASCIRRPEDGMVVQSGSARATSARKMVFELLVADQPSREKTHDKGSQFWSWAERLDIEKSRFPAQIALEPDLSHPAMAVNLDACINCTLCIRACREVQVNDVIGMAGRGAEAKIVFDFDDPMGDSTCVACGECVQACPTGALLPSTVTSSDGLIEPDRQVDSICPYCGVGCQLTYKIKEDKLLSVDGRDGPANHNRLCVKGRFGFDYIHHPDRLTRPLIRKGGIAKDPDANYDPATPLKYFREATWDEALEFAASGLKKVVNETGGSALAGFGSAKGSNEEAYLFQKLVRTGFGNNNVDHCTRLCHASSVAALMETVNSGAVSAPFYDVAKSDVIIVIGANPTVNHPVAATFFKNAVNNGAKLIVMDPRGQALSRHATHMVRFKSGSDVALLNAMMHTIVEENLTDNDYVERHTEGFEEIKEHLRGFSPETMSDICGVDANRIRTIAREYAKADRSIIFWGMGISQHVHGTDNSRCLISLALMTGHVGRPGTGLHPLRGQNNVQGASDAGLIPMFFPDYLSVEKPEVRARFEKFWASKLDPKPGLTVVEIMDSIRNGDIRAMYIMGENPAMSDPDARHARQALAALDHLVLQDLFLTETAFHADVILPASAFPEKEGSFTNTNRQVQIGRKALPLPGDAKQDLWIIQEIARRIGLDWQYNSPKEVFDEMAACMPSFKGITWESLQILDSVTYPLDDNGLSQEVIFQEGFPTTSGRGKFVPADILPPDEVPDDAYPMILTTGRLLEHWHTGAMTRRADILDSLEPEATANLSTKDLIKMDIAPGEMIKVETRRGIIELKARADRDVPEGVVFIPFCYSEAAANILTNAALDPAGKIPEFKFCAARIEKSSTAATK